MSTLNYSPVASSPVAPFGGVTLADALLPGASSSAKAFGRDALLVVGGSVLTAIAAQVAVPLPFTPVPVNGSTFAVLLCGAALGWKRGALSQLVYLAQAAAGLPVLALGLGGVVAMTGPTGGYLAAFPLAAALTGFLAEREWDRKVLGTVTAMTLGLLVIYAMGLAWLTTFVGAANVVAAGLLPFLVGDALKIGLAAAILPAAWKLVRRQR